MKKCLFCKTAQLIAAIGAINWGLIAVFNFNLVTQLFGETTSARIIYGLIGGLGVIVLVNLFRSCPLCQK